MNEREQRIAIAEACNFDRWVIVKRGLYYREGACGYTTSIAEAWKVPKAKAKQYEMYAESSAVPECEKVRIKPAPLPDYLNDLNAMFSAEEVLLTGDGWKERLAKYSSKLMAVMHDTDFGRIDVAFKNDKERLRFYTLHAKASQRAEAFLRVLNLWTD